MSFWKKLFGRDFDTLAARGEQLFDEERFGEARIELEGALTASKGVDKKRLDEIRNKLTRARDRLAEQHLAEAEVFIEEGEIERAVDLAETAADVAQSDEIKQRAADLIDKAEADDARAAFEEAQDMTDEERFVALSGSWEDDQADELESYGEEFRAAFLQLHEGKAEEAAAKMKALLDDVEDPLYLHLELGIAQQAAGQLDEAISSIRTFLDELKDEIEAIADEEEDEDDEDARPGANARIRAHTELARIHIEREDVDAAEKELRRLVELLPEQSGPYVELGRFLRLQGRLDEAIEVLEQGQEFMGAMRPDMSVPREIGLTEMERGNDDDAIASLKAVIDYNVGLGNYNFDPATAVPLAALYERNDKLEDAVHLYRHLTAGSHASGHFAFNLEAGRLLIETGDAELARKHLSRASELAEGEEAQAKVDELIGKLE